MSKIIIWIRHGRKKYDNSKGPSGCYQHDSPLEDNQDDIIINKGRELINKYGKPKECITSPFRRTRETANLLTKDLDIPIKVSTLVSEYLGNQITDTSHIEESTAEHNPPLNENFNDLITRCNMHLSYIGAHDTNFETEIIWVVTHGVVIKTIFKTLNRLYNNYKINEVKELDAFILHKTMFITHISQHKKEEESIIYDNE